MACTERSRSPSSPSTTRLVAETNEEGSPTHRYAYDPVGNLVQKDELTLHYGEPDWPAQAPWTVEEAGLEPITYHYTYDANGNRVRMEGSDEVRFEAGYDEQNRLAHMEPG